jgi:uncharacterized membrane protein YccC
MKVNWQAFNPKLGLRVVITIVVAVLFADWVGLAGPIIALGALVISMADSHGPLRERMTNLLGFTLLSTVITGIAWAVTGEMWPVVITIFLVTLLGGLAMIYGPQRAMEGGLLTVWLIILLPGIGSESLGAAVLATLLGGLLVMAMALIFHVITPSQHPAAPTTPAEKPEAKSNAEEKPRLSWKSPVTQFAVSKSLAAALATLIGWLLIGSHPFWATWAPLMIIKPDLHQTGLKGVNRVFGTVLGGLTGYLLITPINNNTILSILFLAAIFFQMATMGVHYAIGIFFLTMNLVISGKLGGGVPESLSLDRVVATIIGVIISFVVVLILSRLWKTDNPVASQS